MASSGEYEAGAITALLSRSTTSSVAAKGKGKGKGKGNGKGKGENASRAAGKGAAGASGAGVGAGSKQQQQHKKGPRKEAAKRDGEQVNGGGKRRKVAAQTPVSSGDAAKGQEKGKANGKANGSGKDGGKAGVSTKSSATPKAAEKRKQGKQDPGASKTGGSKPASSAGGGKGKGKGKGKGDGKDSSQKGAVGKAGGGGTSSDPTVKLGTSGKPLKPGKRERMKMKNQEASTPPSAASSAKAGNPSAAPAPAPAATRTPAPTAGAAAARAAVGALVAVPLRKKPTPGKKRRRDSAADGDVELDGGNASSAKAKAAAAALLGASNSKRVKVDPKAVKSKKALRGVSAAAIESDERLARTLFLGNVTVHATAKAVKRLVNAFLNGEELPLPPKPRSSDENTPPHAASDDAPGADWSEDELTDEEAEEAEEAGEAEDGKESEQPQAGAGGKGKRASGGKKGKGGASASAPAASAGAGADPSEKPPVRKNYVESVRIRSVPVSGTAIAEGSDYRKMRKACAILGELDSGVKDTVNAYVVLRSEEDAQRAARLNGKKYGDKHLRADVAGSGTDSVDHRTSVFVGNIPFTATDEELRDLFAGAVEGGNDSIKYVRIIRDKATNKGKGFGYVSFTDRMKVFEAMKMHGKKLKDREIRVTRCKPLEKQKGASTHEGMRTGSKDLAKEQKKAAVRRLTRKSAAQKAKDAAKIKKTAKTLRSMKKAIRAHTKGVRKAQKL